MTAGDRPTGRWVTLDKKLSTVSQEVENSDVRSREWLTKVEVERLATAARKRGRHGILQGCTNLLMTLPETKEAADKLIDEKHYELPDMDKEKSRAILEQAPSAKIAASGAIAEFW